MRALGLRLVIKILWFNKLPSISYAEVIVWMQTLQ